MRYIRIWVICFAVFFIITFSNSPALAWKPKTHLFTAAVAVEEILAGCDCVTIDGRTYDVDPDIAQAIRSYPEHYFGGVVGPDGFPDIIFGQSKIHPDDRCDNGNLVDFSMEHSPDRECLKREDGHTFTDDWLEFLYDEAWAYYGACDKDPDPDRVMWVSSKECPDDPGAVLAFMYGYLTHAAGDMWGHSFVNEFARGVFPEIVDGNASDKGIAIRHLIVEGYVGDHTPGGTSGLDALKDYGIDRLDAPTSFIHQKLIVHSTATDYAPELHFNKFLELKKLLNEAEGNAEVQALNIACSGTHFPPKDCIEDWKNDIDVGLEAWPEMSLDVANELFINDNADAAITRAQEFGADYVLEMLGAPGFAGDVILIMSKIGSILDPLTEPLSEFQKYLFEAATGIDVDRWKDYFTNPASYINCTNDPINLDLINLEPDTSQRLDKEMGITSTQSYPCDPPSPPVMDNVEKFDPLKFPAAKNTVVLSKLVLLSPDELNKLLYDHHVGAIYSDLPGLRNNAILSFIRTIDGNHQWRSQAPATAAGGTNSYGSNGGMPLWRDCLARDRVFRAIFEDWQNGDENFPPLGEGCDKISEPLPPVEFILTPAQEALPGYSCFGITFTAKLINHKDEPQPFALYVQIWNDSGNLVYHEVISGQGISEESLGSFETRDYHFSAPRNGCDGEYEFKAYLFERMRSLEDLEDELANPLIQPTDLLPHEVNSLETRTFVITTNPTLCQLQCYRCEMGFVPSDANDVGGIGSFTCIDRVQVTCDIPCAALPTIGEGLDADQDGIPDVDIYGQQADNCPTVSNNPDNPDTPDQADENGNGIGDVCEVYVVTILPDLDGILSLLLENIENAEKAQNLEELFGEPEVPQGLGPWCLTCPGVFDELSPAVLEFTKAFDEGLISAGIYDSTMRDIVRGPSVRTDTTEVLSVSLDGGRNAMILEIEAPANDKITIRLPRALLDAKRNDQIANLVVLVDGRIQPSFERLSATYRVIEIPLRAGDSEIQIRGTQLGPRITK